MKQLTSPPPSRAAEIGGKLMAALTVQASRKVFFSTLSQLLQEQFHFDRLCINLYDQQGEMLMYFTAAEGTVVSTVSPVRPAEASTTVAGHVIATRKPVIITDFAQYFSESPSHPIAEAGLTATMAFPLVLDNDIIATLHCSFIEQPEDIYSIVSFLLELSPVVATCLGAILSLEQVKYNEMRLHAQPFFLPPGQNETIICHSNAMREIMRKIDMAAKLNIPVLLLGETGTGKSLFAQEIHHRSPRKSAHFVKVNCPALPQTLFESELFGHAKGAFTGAAGRRVGRFELAHGGTLFLDEVAELSSEMQSKLLQVLEDSSFERVGESVSLPVDVRIIAATNARFGTPRGGLRADLLHRLAFYTIELPPLRERREDIPPLASLLSLQTGKRLNLPSITFTASLIAPLREYDWPGNIRELRNIISKLLVHNCMHKQVTVGLVEKLLQESRGLSDMSGAASAETPPVPGGGLPRKKTSAPQSLEEVERRHIIEALEHTGGIIAGPTGAAALLGLPRTTLQHKMRRLGIRKAPQSQAGAAGPQP